MYYMHYTCNNNNNNSLYTYIFAPLPISERVGSGNLALVGNLRNGAWYSPSFEGMHVYSYMYVYSYITYTVYMFVKLYKYIYIYIYAC